jgi:prepilin-type N-terminal cleavage/methylation domain-containing protein
MASGPHSTRGFSLMELMIVLVVFGMVLGFGVPSYRRYSQTQALRGTAQNLVNTIQLQRARAMAEGQSVRIDFDTASPAGWTCLSAGRQNVSRLPRGVRYLSASPATITITRDGRLNSSGTVVFANDANVSDTVSIQLTGFAMVR